MKIVWIMLLIAVSMPAESLIESGGGREPHRSAKRTWIRRATLAASCAASFLMDARSTQRHIAAGGVELNPLFANAQGGANWGRIIGMKAGFCGASAVVQETNLFGLWRGRTADWTWTGANAATTALYTWAGMHNLSQIEKTPLQPGAAEPQSVPNH